MAINIGNQSGGQINNVEGVQNISGQSHYTVAVSIGEARVAARDLSSELQRLRLPADVGGPLREQVEAVRRELAAGDPDRGRVAGRLERITAELGRLGAFAEAGSRLVGPLRALGRWLGPVGATLLSQLT